MTVTADTEAAIAPAAPHTPVAPAGASYVGVLAALGLIALGAVALRDAAVVLGWLRGNAWSTAVVEHADGLTPSVWMIPVGVAAGVLGLVCIVAALTPRRKTSIPLTARTAVYLAKGAVARIADDAARSVSGVLDARSSASRAKVVVRARVTETAVSGAITEAVELALTPLGSRPRVVVHVTTGDRP